MKTPKWHKKLTQSELQHIADTTNRKTLNEIRRNIEGQKKNNIDCIDCRIIARKLGIIV